MKYLKRFINDLLYGYPAFSNLKWGIIQDIREKTGFYTMDKIPLERLIKYGDILTHKGRTIEKEDIDKLFKAIHDYNEVIAKL